LFRAAIEAYDEHAVRVILQTTANTPNMIDPNGIICNLEGGDRLYTPIETAAKFRQLGTVELLAPNVDINKTYEQDTGRECGALELTIRKMGRI
jgi:hypothetical protein